MVVEACRACGSGNGPSETTHAIIATVTKAQTIAEATATARRLRRLTTPSSPGLSRPSTSLTLTPADVDARDAWRGDGGSRAFPAYDEGGWGAAFALLLGR